MEFGTAVIWAFLLVFVGLIVWFCIGLLKFLFRAMTSTVSSSSSAQYPEGADEPDGSSYSEVHGEVRLD